MERALVQRAVESFARFCAYDPAGYAWSDRGPVDDGIEEIMDDLTLLLRKARITPPYILVGYSLGSLYGRAYQRRFPEQVFGLVLVDGPPGAPPFDRLPIGLQQARQWAFEKIIRDFLVAK